MSQRVVVRGEDPGELIALVPYLLHFHPQESLVIVALGQSEVVLTARVDLADELLGMGRYLTRVLTDNGADEVVLLAYSQRQELAERVLRGLAEGLGFNFGVGDALRVTADRWWSLFCHDPACCPPEGTPYDATTAVSAAEAVLAGMPALPSRQALVESAQGPDADLLPVCRAAFESVLPELCDLTGTPAVQLLDEEIAAAVEAAEELTPVQCARFAVLVSDLVCRDAALFELTRQNAGERLELWQQVVRHCVSPFEAAPLCIAGMAAWLNGNGALQAVYLERAAQLHPGYSLVELLDEINARAISPDRWEDFLAA